MILTMDAETFFSDEFSLSKMTTEAYCRDARFEVHGWAVRSPQHDPVWWTHVEAVEKFKQIDWSQTDILAHHAQFDLLILSHIYGVRPRFIFDTLSQARLLLGNHLSVGLDSLAKHFNLQAKNVPYNLFRNKHWGELAPAVQQQVAAGACHDVNLTWQLFNILGKEMPRDEYQVIDTTVRMFTEPCLIGDIELLGKVWTDEATKKDARMAALNVSATELQSSDKFAELLRAEGVEPEMKEGKNKPIYCFAKTDEFMRGLQEHDNERVRTLCEARLGAKSTLNQTRAETLGFMSQRGAMPVYLRYCGAHTTRWSGGDGCLTSDTQVLVFDWQKGLTEKRIVDILADDRIWDGVEFVNHGGIKFSGYQEIIEHDGVRGTEGHIVYGVSGKEISLEEAARTGTRLMDCPTPSRRQVAAMGQSFKK